MKDEKPNENLLVYYIKYRMDGDLIYAKMNSVKTLYILSDTRTY